MRATFILVILSTGCGGTHKAVNNVAHWGTDVKHSVTIDQVPVVVSMPYGPDVEGDDDLHEIVNEFYADAQWLKHPVVENTRSIAMVADLEADGPDVIGYCNVWSNPDGTQAYKEIKLLQSFWDTASYCSRRSLVYHELGHCALELPHVPLGSGAIMEPVILADKLACRQWIDLVENEFSSSTVK